MTIPAALMLEQAAAVRASICGCAEVNRFCVFMPSVSRTSACWVLGGKAGALSGRPEVSACHPQASPIVWLVLPVAIIESILALSALQLLLSGMIDTGHPDDWSAGK